MASLLGTIVGGALACTLLGLLAGLVFKGKEPGERALFAALAAWVLAGVLAGFGMADRGSFKFSAILIYLPGAVIAFFYLRWHYRKMWRDDDALERTFE